MNTESGVGEIPANQVKAIIADYKKWQKEFASDFHLPQANLSGDRTLQQFRQDLLEMATHANISQPPVFKSHRKFLGPVIVLGKKTVSRLLKPFIRIFMFRQIRMNQLVMGMAYRVAQLEDRVKELEAEHAKSR